MLIAGSLAPATGLAAEKSQPNVIVILADDLGYGDLSCYGGKIPTPHLDRLAQQGVKFTDAHTSSAVCTPTRYGLLTGRYNWRSPLKRGVLGGLSPRLIEPGRETLASVLQQNGYQTACIGKWHLGMDWHVKPGQEVTEFGIETREQVFSVDYSQPIQNGPNSVGFTEFFGISGSLDMVPYAYLHNNRVVDLPTEDRQFLMMSGRPEGSKTRQGPTSPGFEVEDVLPTLIQKSQQFVREQAEAKQPFFLYLPLASPHTPIAPTSEWQGKSGFNPYADFVMQTDAAVGQLLETVDQQQLTSNTLIIFTSDNGCSPQAKFAELAEHDHYPSGSLRGHKADLFEGGHRVPFLVRWPGQIPAGKSTEALICLTDIFATVAEITDISLNDQTAEDSVSFWPVLQKSEQDSALKSAQTGGRTHLVSHSINGSFAIREGNWKLLLCPDSGGWSAPRPGTKQAQNLPAVQLYDLKNDLAETTNLADQHPERVQSLRAQLQKFVEQGRSTPGQPQSNTGEVQIEPASGN